MSAYVPEVSFEHSPTVGDFALDWTHFVRNITGPLGSGKSVGCCAVAMAIALRQMVDQHDYRRSRFAIIRNTSPELKTTTINTWKEIFPEDACGDIVFSSPITHHIHIPPRGGDPGLDAEFYFIPLDKPQDIKKLKSLDLTAAWINESAEVPSGVMKMLRGRVGRFPPRNKDYQAVNPCVFMDTNAFDDDHWLADLEDQRAQGYEFYTQPPAVLECTPQGKGFVSIEPDQDKLTFLPDQIMTGANRFWAVNPKAENLPHLRDGYYADQIAGSDLEWIRRFLQARRIYYTEGKPVIPEYIDEVFTKKFEPLREVPFKIGMDIGGGTLQPAAVIAQRGPRGIWLIHDELVMEDMGVNRYSNELVRLITERYSGLDNIESCWGDPAAEKRDEIFETVVFDHLKSKGLPARAAPSNNIQFRIDAIKAPIMRFIDGQPGMLIHPRCKLLRKGLAGRWHFRRMQVAGEDRFTEQPVKNKYSHPCDALGYLLSGGGETMQARRATHQEITPAQRPHHAKIDFDVFNS